MGLQLSHTEENYLKAIYHISTQKNIKAVTTNLLADNLSTTPASANDMMKKLDAKSLIHYQKYKGSSLLPEGKKLALSIIRKHRLWEVFLVEILKFRWDEVHEIAEQLEHIKSPILTKRLDDFLGNPRVDPHGDPIPDENGYIMELTRSALSKVAIGTNGVVVAVNEDNPSLLHHLDQLKIKIGSKITVIDRMEFDQSLIVEVDNQPNTFLSKVVAENLMITIINN